MKNSYLNDAFFSRLETCALNLRPDLSGFFGGKHFVKTYGQTVEFADYREYMLGDDIRRIGPEYCIVKEDIETAIAGSCLSIKQVKEYAGWDIGMNYADMKDLYGWHISNFKLYKKPVKLKDFWAIQPCTHRGNCCTCRRWNAEKLICRGAAFGIERPPQSWYYVEDGR